MKLNLGCPKYCEGWVCVDIAPRDPRVIKADAYEALRNTDSNALSEIRSKNLLEHLENPGSFLHACYFALPPGGKLTVITDNAEFLPFYAPFWVRHTGLGAHSCNEYALDHCNSPHYSVFTKMHLLNLFVLAGFKREFVTIRRTWGGARVEAVATK